MYVMATTVTLTMGDARIHYRRELSVAATVTCLWKNALKSARFRAIMVTGVRARKGIKIGLLDLRACR
jgi:hypothetical protein